MQQKQTKVAAEEAARRRRDDAEARIPRLIQDLLTEGLHLAEPRFYFTYEQRAFGRRKEIRHDYEPAIPLGDLSWEYYYVGTHPDVSRKQQSKLMKSGITADGEIVPMEADAVRGLSALKLSYRRWQVEKIAELLEAALQRARED